MWILKCVIIFEEVVVYEMVGDMGEEEINMVKVDFIDFNINIFI